jgi:hypothetical protein
VEPRFDQPSGATFLFIVALCAVFLGIIAYGIRTGRLPSRGGGIVERQKNPRLFVFGLLTFMVAAASMILFVLVALKRGVLW